MFSGCCLDRVKAERFVILNAREFLRDTIAESVQANLLGVPRAESA
ncbi:MAG: hypothetical protein JW741_05795 [Sedimentisphaerales bacterium]|nr:hypothetical protein [Sedimentisphaerales bacterium]